MLVHFATFTGGFMRQYHIPALVLPIAQEIRLVKGYHFQAPKRQREQWPGNWPQRFREMGEPAASIAQRVLRLGSVREIALLPGFLLVIRSDQAVWQWPTLHDRLLGAVGKALGLPRGVLQAEQVSWAELELLRNGQPDFRLRLAFLGGSHAA